MKDTLPGVKVAAVQASPVLFDKAASLAKAADYIEKAGALGASLVVFPESFIPCYPRGITFGLSFGGNSFNGRGDYTRYYENSVVLPHDLSPVCEAAKRAGCWVSVGITERDPVSGTLYCTNVFIDGGGSILGRHRKLKPTGAERCVWGEGDAADLAAFETPFGTVGSLICWENYMPLARYALYEQGVSIYIAPTADSRKEWQATVRHIAQEGRCFVISCNQFVTRDMYPSDLQCANELENAIFELCPGGSCIISPTGKYLCPPVYHKEEMLICTLDLTKLPSAKLDLDVCGHYSRPDIFEFKIKR